MHARGREAVLYAARAGVDLIFHAYYLDDECIEAMLESGSAIGPTLTFPRNIVDFTQPHEPAATKGRIGDSQREYEIACENLRKAREAGVPMMTGTDSGFAVTPYGEWHARELEIFVRDLGFTPAEALRARPRSLRGFMADGDRIGVLEQGRAADFIAVRRLAAGEHRDPAGQDAGSARCISAASRMQIPDRGYDPRQVTDLAWTNWTDLYTQERVGRIGDQARPAAAGASGLRNVNLAELVGTEYPLVRLPPMGPDREGALCRLPTFPGRCARASRSLVRN